ncbi:hypothetical protein Poli38472_000968 [Pythium oligandrum]|uniref:Uncharacterized protein n=1 Tax=Pythium oligandrum TaxID=41045 RepID=A0A8K1CDK6_PYTOL|nr:hypothetical protein Poli38472_000968 [Pythium oligandrum]|eukprot:TMW60926.1 hypothetical protein Poli38472_000968 [Pythium oligandrum]
MEVDAAARVQPSDVSEGADGVESGVMAASVGSPRRNGAEEGVQSGEILLRLRGTRLCDKDGVLDGLSTGLRGFLLEKPSVEDDVAPWKHRLASLRSKRRQIQEWKRRLRERYEHVHASIDAECTMSVNGALKEAALEPLVVENYLLSWQTLSQLYAQNVKRSVIQFYATLEAENAVIRDWQTREASICQEMLDSTKRGFQLASFAAHLESETSEQIRLWRLPPLDAQRQRCVKAASENIRKGFFAEDSTMHVEVTDVYKIENRPLLAAFERFTQESGHVGKVKGLFCVVPSSSVEHCVVWGMHGDEAAFARTCGLDESDTVFSRPNLLQEGYGSSEADAPGTRRGFIARQRAANATSLAFPRRFSRYSTLRENESLTDSNERHYLALCRVAMGKTVRLSSVEASASFPQVPSVGSFFVSEDEEYVLRYPQAVVPEFLVEYHFAVGSRNETTVMRDAMARVVPVDLSNLCIEPPSNRFQFEADELVARAIDASSSASDRKRFDGGSMLVFDASTGAGPMLNEANPANRRRLSDQTINTDQMLDNCAKQRRLLRDDLERMRRVLWSQSKSLWTRLDQKEKKEGSQKDVQDLVSSVVAAQPMLMDTKEMVSELRATQSLKARKLYEDVVGVRRQNQVRDNEKRPQASVTSTKLRKTTAVRPVLRPFR